MKGYVSANWHRQFVTISLQTRVLFNEALDTHVINQMNKILERNSRICLTSMDLSLQASGK